LDYGLIETFADDPEQNLIAKMWEDEYFVVWIGSHIKPVIT